jgi:hypothetical protein
MKTYDATTLKKTGAIFYFIRLEDIEAYQDRWGVFGKRAS